MPKIADELERESRTVDLEQGDFERLLGRRERQQRNRRIRAGALGVIVALAMGTILVRSLTSDPVPVDPPVVPRPAPAPAASGALAYVLDGDVYVADPDGSNAVKIADGLGDDDCATTDGVSFWAEGSMWSPDGRYLAYRHVDCSSEKPGWRDQNWGDVVVSDVAGNELVTFPADGWDIGWSPDSSRVAAWETLFETVVVYGVDGTRQAEITMPSGFQPSGDHDPAWLRDGTLAVDAVELPLDGGAARSLDQARAAEWRDDYAATIRQRVDSPDGSHAAYVQGDSLRVEGSDGAGSVTLLTVERGTSLGVIGFSPEGDRILFERNEHPQAGGDRGELWSVGVDGSDARLVVAGTVDGDWFVPSVVSGDDPANPPVELQPAASGALAYVLDGDVYVADPDGLNAVKIADGRPQSDCQGTGEYWAEGSIWSPDGRYLAYRGADCDGLQEGAWSDVVIISDAEGNIVASFPADGWDIGWSPDSTRVAVWDSLFETIGVYGVDGARQTQLTMPSGLSVGGDNDPMWVPDGTSLMVNNVEVPLDGSTSRKLPWGAEAYSPDGSHVAYADRRSLTVARSDGSEPREVFEDWTGDPTWSPTGDRIAFTTSVLGPASAELRVLDVASGSVRLLTEAERGTSLGVIGFSPKGDRILFRKTEDQGAHESSLWSIGVDGSDPRLLVAGPFYGDWLSR